MLRLHYFLQKCAENHRRSTGKTSVLWSCCKHQNRENGEWQNECRDFISFLAFEVSSVFFWNFWNFDYYLFLLRRRQGREFFSIGAAFDHWFIVSLHILSASCSLSISIYHLFFFCCTVKCTIKAQPTCYILDFASMYK